MNAASMRARVVRLVHVIGVLMLAGCGGGGGSADWRCSWRESPCTRHESHLRPSRAQRERFSCDTRSVLSAYPGCPRGLDKVGFPIPTCLPHSAYSPRASRPATVVTVDGQPFDAASIPDGSVAIVRGLRTLTNEPGVPRETSVATAIDIQRTVVGTIESVDLAHARFSVLGQQIYVSDLTRISGNGTTDALAVGKRVAVSGFFSPTGEVVATAITDDAHGQGFVLRGILQIDPLGAVKVGRLAIGSVHDDVFEGFPEDPSTPGQTGPVRHGSPVLVLADTPPFNGALTPYSVQVHRRRVGCRP